MFISCILPVAKETIRSQQEGNRREMNARHFDTGRLGGNPSTIIQGDFDGNNLQQYQLSVKETTQEAKWYVIMADEFVAAT